MSLFRRPLLHLLLAAVTGGMALSVFAGGEQSREQRGANRSNQQSREDDDTLSDAVRRVERATQGQVLSAERVQFDGRDINRVKVVDDRGRVRIYVDDPQKPARSSDAKPARTRGDDNDDPNL